MKYKVNLKKPKKVMLLGFLACLDVGHKGRPKRKFWRILKTL